jgi:hypothetical protein
LKAEPRCRVCASGKHREEIEWLLIEGYTPTSIAKNLPVEDGTTARNIQTHMANGHCTITEAIGDRLADDARER